MVDIVAVARALARSVKLGSRPPPCLPGAPTYLLSQGRDAAELLESRSERSSLTTRLEAKDVDLAADLGREKGVGCDRVPERSRVRAAI